MPPTGRMKKPPPKVAVVSNSEAYWVSEGKNSREMTTVRKPKIIKSYHSRAFPITAAATWRDFDADRPEGIGAKFIKSPLKQLRHGTRRCAVCEFKWCSNGVGGFSDRLPAEGANAAV